MSPAKKEDEVLGFLTGLERLMEASSSYAERKVALTEGPITVSTVYVTDLKCYETAIQDANNVYPVERYESEKAAVKGHERWETFARSGDGKEIVELAWPGAEAMIPARVIKLKAVKKGVK